MDRAFLVSSSVCAPDAFSQTWTFDVCHHLISFNWRPASSQTNSFRIQFRHIWLSMNCVWISVSHFLYSYWPRIHFEMRKWIKIKITFVCNKMSQCHFACDCNVQRIQNQIFMHFPRPISHRGYSAWLQSTKSLKSFHSKQLLNSAPKDIKSS